MSAPFDIPASDEAPTLTPDLAYKRDVLRRRLGRELGDCVFRVWLERSLAAVTPEPEEPAVAGPASPPAREATPDNGYGTHSSPEPRGMRAAHDPGANSAPADAGAGEIAADLAPDLQEVAPVPCAERNASLSGPSPEAEEEAVAPEPQPAPRGGCLWPEGDPPTHTWCGAKRSPGRPYCPEHCLRAYQKSNGSKWPLERFHSPPPQVAAA